MLLVSRFAITKKSTSSTIIYVTFKVVMDNLKRQNDRDLLGLYNDIVKQNVSCLHMSNPKGGSDP